MTLARPTDALVWELRGAWASRRIVRLTLTERCLVRKVVGRVQRVAVTGAFVDVDGWQVPAEDILSVGYPTVVEREEYAAARVAPPED